MHDPLVVAFEIKLPVPRITGWGRPPEGHKKFTVQRRRYKPIEERMQYMNGVPIYHPWRPAAWYVWVGQKQLKMRTFCTIWHKEPHGQDSGEICSHWKIDRKSGMRVAFVTDDRHKPCGHPKLHYRISNSWRWHIQHWHLQFPWLQEIRRTLFQRCAWCGGRSTRKDYVNCTYQWDGRGPKHWWQSDPHLYHSDCMTPEHAWRSCSCIFPALPVLRDPHTGEIHGVRDYGKCDFCGRFHGWRSTPEQKAVYEYIRSTTPPNTRMSPEVKAEVHRRFAEIRKQKEQQDETSP